MDTSRSRSSMYESSVSYVMRSLSGAVAVLCTSCGIHDAKLGSLASTFLMISFFSLGNRARESGGSPFRCNTDPKVPDSSCVTFSFYAVSADSGR